MIALASKTFPQNAKRPDLVNQGACKILTYSTANQKGSTTCWYQKRKLKSSPGKYQCRSMGAKSSINQNPRNIVFGGFMMKVDLTKNVLALLAAHELFSTADLDPLLLHWLKANRVDLPLVENLTGPIVRTTGSFIESWYEPDAIGENCFAFAVYGEDAETVIDIVAWSARDQYMFAPQFERAEMIGVDQIHNPASFANNKHCRIHRTPLRWLQADCEGVVILDYEKARKTLSRVTGSLDVEDVDYARELVNAGIINPSKLFVPMVDGISA